MYYNVLHFTFGTIDTQWLTSSCSRLNFSDWRSYGCSLIDFHQSADGLMVLFHNNTWCPAVQWAHILGIVWNPCWAYITSIQHISPPSNDVHSSVATKWPHSVCINYSPVNLRGLQGHQGKLQMRDGASLSLLVLQYIFRCGILTSTPTSCRDGALSWHEFNAMETRLKHMKIRILLL